MCGHDFSKWNIEAGRIKLKQFALMYGLRDWSPQSCSALSYVTYTAIYDKWKPRFVNMLKPSLGTCHRYNLLVLWSQSLLVYHVAAGPDATTKETMMQLCKPSLLKHLMISWQPVQQACVEHFRKQLGSFIDIHFLVCKLWNASKMSMDWKPVDLIKQMSDKCHVYVTFSINDLVTRVTTGVSVSLRELKRFVDSFYYMTPSYSAAYKCIMESIQATLAASELAHSDVKIHLENIYKMIPNLKVSVTELLHVVLDLYREGLAPLDLQLVVGNLIYTLLAYLEVFIGSEEKID